MTRFLTKSRFMLGAECPTKLNYAGKPTYVDRRNEDNFLLALADGGFQVGRLAQLMHPGGIPVDESDPELALARTQELLTREQVTVFEAALAFQNFFIRVDILNKNGNDYELIEVKAKSYSASEDGNLTGKRGGIKAEFKPYLLDVCFQRFVARQALPGAKVRAFLMMVDKAMVATVDGLNQRFQIRKEGGRTRIEVVNSDENASLGASILTVLNVDSQLDVLSSQSLPVAPGTSLPFDQAAVTLASAYADDRRIDPEPSKTCGDCQFRADRWPTDGELESGFHECWAQAFGMSPDDFNSATVLDIWNFRGKDDLVRKGVVKASQVHLEDLGYDGSPPGADGLSTKQRQWYVCRREWPGGGDFYFDSDGVRRAMADWRYPLHFIDFETSMAAIPFTKGKRPYQLTAFQFSHHEMQADGSVRHRDQWLGAEPGRDPNADFVRALKAVLSRDQGSIFRWAPHENTVLNTLRTELLTAAEPPTDRDELVAFIESITTRGDDVGPRNMIDLWDLSGKFFFHPATKGSAALKRVLPALMSSSTHLRELYGAATYGPSVSQNLEQPVAWWQERDGVVLDPYSLLPPLFDDFSPEELAAVDESLPEELREGGAAMVAYARLQSEDLPEGTRKAMERGLLRYCELDTLAMAMVVQAWQGWIASS